MPVFPSEEWVREWVELANDSEEFRVAGQGWAGAACLVVRDVPNGPIHIRLEGRDGHWSGHAVGSDGGLVSGARIVLTASLLVWKDVIRQELSPLKGILLGRVALRGHLPDVLRYRASVTTLCVLAGQMETEFAGD